MEDLGIPIELRKKIRRIGTPKFLIHIHEPAQDGLFLGILFLFVVKGFQCGKNRMDVEMWLLVNFIKKTKRLFVKLLGFCILSLVLVQPSQVIDCGDRSRVLEAQLFLPDC